MGLQGPIRFASIRRIQLIQSIEEVDSVERESSPAEVEMTVGANGPTRGARKNLMEGGRP